MEIIMNILIVGSGGREHAVCKKLLNCNLYYYGTHSNPKMNLYATLLGIGNLKNVTEITQKALHNNINMVIVGPETPLSCGLSDELAKYNIPTIGPTKDMALIETSKHFARELLFNNGLGKYCPKLLHVINHLNCDYDQLSKDLNETLKIHKVVIKPDGICGGKGVMVQDDHFTTKEEIINYCKQVNSKIIIEEKLVGEEFSIMSFTDGYTLKHMIPVKDYKRLLDGNLGPNTGSMGSVTGYDGKLWFLDDEDIKECQMINEMIIDLLRKDDKVYKGILYGSFMKTVDKEIKVIEFNARFGDPECINVLELLNNDLLDIFKKICNQELHKIELSFRREASVFKYKVPKGYPDHSQKDIVVFDGDMICANMIKNEKGDFVTLGSRAFGVILCGEDISQICHDVNKLLDKETKLFYRKDIGSQLSLSYNESGVNTEEKALAIEEIKQDILSTYNGDVLSDFGDFAGIMRFGDKTLITSTDGVGTKSIMVLDYYGYEKGFEMLGNDLVILNANDILVKMGHPLFFLDYFGCHKLNATHLKCFVKGITNACKSIKCSLIKGETAQMPDIYHENTFDLVGTIVGYCDGVLNGKEMIQEGDIVIGLPSNGPHTNGFSLIRKIIDRVKQYENINPKIMEALCAPHKNYYDDVMTLKNQVDIHGLCHITGGGFIDNPERVLPDGFDINYCSWKMPYVFEYLQEKGHLSNCEMKKTFNCGIGMLVVIPENDLNKIKGIDYVIVGHVTKK